MANKIYQVPETAVVFQNSGGDVAFSPASVGNGAGRKSAQLDLGATSAAHWFAWYAETQCQATPTVNNLIRLYLMFGLSTTEIEGDPGTSDAAISSEDDLLDMTHIGNVVVDSATADVKFVKAGLVFVPTRYVSVAWWNASGATLTADNAEHIFKLVPIPDEVQ